MLVVIGCHRYIQLHYYIIYFLCATTQQIRQLADTRSSLGAPTVLPLRKTTPYHTVGFKQAFYIIHFNERRRTTSNAGCPLSRALWLAAWFIIGFWGFNSPHAISISAQFSQYATLAYVHRFVRICPGTVRCEPDRTIRKTSSGFCSGRKNENQNHCLVSSMRCIEQRGPERRIWGLRLLTSVFISVRSARRRAVIIIYGIIHFQHPGVFRRRSPLSQGNREIGADLPERGRLLSAIASKNIRFANLDRCLDIGMVRWYRNAS